MDCGRVLIVDDDQATRETLRHVLENEGFPTAAASDGSEALRWLEVHSGDTRLVLLDLLMPTMNGRQFLTARAGSASLAAVPVVVMSASGPDACSTILQEHDLAGCLNKPVSLANLVDLVGRFVDRPRG
jgi:chemotaxis family two-component system sensor histidine kinase/response regulator PixL